MKNGLYIIATPIGNLNDISLRAQKTLGEVDIIICENPKHSLKILSKLGIKKKLYSIHDYNEEKIIKKIEQYAENSSIALISDAGSPVISDPGFKLVRFYNTKGLNITTVPGPCSIISALQLSSMPINEFQFLGFAPKTAKHLGDFINKVSFSDKTSVFFISSHRVVLFLNIANKIMPEKEICICKEITKLNEKRITGSPKEILNKINKNTINLRGEFVFVIGGDINYNQKKTFGDLDKQIIKLLSKFSLTDVVEIVHKINGVSKKEIYNMALKLKK